MDKQETNAVFMIPIEEQEKSLIVETVAKNNEDIETSLDKVKSVLNLLRSQNPDKKYPPDEAIDSLAQKATAEKPLYFLFSQHGENTEAAAFGFKDKKDLELRWVFSASPGEGIKLIKELQNKFDYISLKASPYGYEDGEQTTQLNKIVEYYTRLGFSKTRDHKDTKYGGNVPMSWRYNKLMGGR